MTRTRTRKKRHRSRRTEGGTEDIAEKNEKRGKRKSGRTLCKDDSDMKGR